MRPGAGRQRGALPKGAVPPLSCLGFLFRKRIGGVANQQVSALCGLLHDICKAQFYKISTRNVKNDETGQWEKRPFYTVEDAFPYGHGEKSVYLIERFVRLKPAEAMAIRWHMGGFDDSVKGGSFAISTAFDRYPLAVKLHLADLEATYLMEHGTSEVRH